MSNIGKKIIVVPDKTEVNISKSKITVKGSKKHPIYDYLTKKSKNNYKDSRVTWNFQKYLISREGLIEKIVSPKTNPDSEEIISWITDGE